MAILYGLFQRSHRPSAELAALQQIGSLIVSDRKLHVLVALLQVDGDIATLSLEWSGCKCSVLNRLLLALI
nr:hypothetical protein DOP62_07710 [Synechococcus elongatus PCC 11801]